MSTVADIKLIIADDHEIFRDGFKLMLSKFPEIILVGEAANGKELLELTEQVKPNVILTDIKMPVMDGIEATKKIAELYPDKGIIGLSMYDDDELIIEMLEAGAKGYLIKNAGKDQIIEAIKTVYNDDPYYCKTTSHKLTQMIAKSRFNPYKKTAKVEFSEREKEIIACICAEMTNKEIGDKLFISVRTVEGHRLKILEKMNVKNTVGLVVYAIKNGIVKAL
ncbi:MAG: response regulator transcription factor [Ferruginibacter sp.]|nr:response regulator transcription factor [Ferruginibacter sp.]